MNVTRLSTSVLELAARPMTAGSATTLTAAADRMQQVGMVIGNLEGTRGSVGVSSDTVFAGMSAFRELASLPLGTHFSAPQRDLLAGTAALMARFGS